MIAVIRGPYSTGAVTPSGALPQVVAPHAQRRATSWCSITSSTIVGRSRTCRRSMPTSAAFARLAPRPPHPPGSCRLRSFGLWASAKVDPECPGCPPGLRPLLRRSDVGAGLANCESDDGGFDEFRLLCPSGASTRRPRPAPPPSSPAARCYPPAAAPSPPEAACSPQQAPHRTDVGQRTRAHDQ